MNGGEGHNNEPKSETTGPNNLLFFWGWGGVVWRTLPPDGGPTALDSRSAEVPHDTAKDLESTRERHGRASSFSRRGQVGEDRAGQDWANQPS